MKQSKKKKAFLPTAITLIGVVAVIVWIWHKQAYASTAAPTYRHDTAQTAAPSALESVDIPDYVPQQMLYYPGFNVSFNAEMHQPNYVSWELTRAESLNREHRRSDKFAPDLSVSGCATLSDYKRSGYDRGHMAPSADMKWSKESMESCFLLTNISPQRKALNAGAWNTLEINCREWALRDSAIVIVCGPILSDHITQYIGESNVAVPERFFKVILAPFADPPRGIGFIMPNTRVNGGLMSTAVSIDEVEEITGFDFFASLPDEIESKVESECNYARWTQK